MMIMISAFVVIYSLGFSTGAELKEPINDNK